MISIGELLAERSKSSLRLRFTGKIEDQYRQDLRRRLKYPRTILLTIIAIGFAVSPLQEQSLFQAPEHLHGVLTLFAWLIAPVALAAAISSFVTSTPRVLAQAVQSAAVVAIFSAVCALRHLGLTSSFQYPASMLGIVISAVAIFGSFSAYRMIPIMLLFYGFGIAQEIYFLSQQSASELPAYTLFYFMLISVLGAYSDEMLRRQSWIQGRAASILARSDALTGLANRGAFNHRYAISFNQARRDKKMLAVLVLDLDHFKRLNDNFGHLAGDDALQRIGGVLSQVAALRPLDICARLGGEEFVVVWYDVSPEGLARLVERLLSAIRAIELTVPGQEEPYKITASAGLTWLIPSTESRSERVLAKADALMYRAKHAGRDQAALESFDSGHS